jgi:hypothetical protein
MHLLPVLPRLQNDNRAGISPLAETINVLTSAGFTSEGVKTIVQRICSNLSELAKRTRLRADTTLKLLADEEFEHCQKELERAALRQEGEEPVIETLDLAVFRSQMTNESTYQGNRGGVPTRYRARAAFRHCK